MPGRPIYLPPPLRILEGTAHPWAVLRWRRGDGIRFTRVLPYGYGRLMCRLGVHVMVRSFIQDARVCMCGRHRINDEWDYEDAR
jgi:hypothetical protein